MNIKDIRVLRSSCEGLPEGFRVHLDEGEWDALYREATNSSDRERLIYENGLRDALRELDAAEKRLRDQTDWYQQRFNTLRVWVNKEVRPLSEEAANRYFAIVANGTPSPHERSDWKETMHGLTLRAESAERLLRTVEGELANTRQIAAMETARANRMSDLLFEAEQKIAKLEGP